MQNMSKLGRLKTKIIIPIVAFVFGAVFSFLGITKYGFYHATKGPLPGFFPSIVGICLMIVSVMTLLQVRSDDDQHSRKENWYPVLGTLAILLGCLVFGMYLSLGIFLFWWVRIYERASWKATIICFVIMGSIVIGVFGCWLNIAFPKGLLFSWM
jgi:hypothetical protein